MWVPITSDFDGYQRFWLGVLAVGFVLYCSFWLGMLYLWLRYR